MTKQYKPFSPEDSREIIAWYKQHEGKPTQKEVSELIGDSASERVGQQLGRETLLESVDKTVKQGSDAIDYDPETNKTIVIENKGIKSKESNLQKDEMHSLRQSEIALHGDRYHTNKISETEIGAAREVIKAHESGELLYQVNHTTIENGELVTNVIKETQPNGELSPNYSDRSPRANLTTESPEDILIRRETAIAAAQGTLENGNLSPRKEQEIRDLLNELISPELETHNEETAIEGSLGKTSAIPYSTSNSETVQESTSHEADSSSHDSESETIRKIY